MSREQTILNDSGTVRTVGYLLRHMAGKLPSEEGGTIMFRKTLLVLLALAMVLTACAKPTPTPTPKPVATKAPPPTETPAPKKFKVIMVPKLVGIDYFASCQQGMEEAAKELGDIDLEVQGTIDANAEKQIELLDSLITRKPDALIISANDPEALAPVCRRAMEAGIKVVTFDADVLPDARHYFINQATFEGIGKALIDEVALQKGEEAKYAIISTTPNAPNQSKWVEAMKAYQPKAYPKMKLVDIRYGEDDMAKTRQQANDLITAYPDLDAFIVPTSVGFPGAAEAVEAAGKTGEIAVIGLATPNGMRDYVKRGVVETVILWNTIDLGYLTMYTTEALLTGKLKPGDKTVQAGRMGEKEIGENNVILLGPPFRFTKENIDQFNF